MRRAKKASELRVDLGVTLFKRGMSIRDASIKAGISDSSLRNRLTKLGLRSKGRTMSNGAKAAHWLAEHGGKLSDAGERFGVSAEAVRQSWRRAFGDRELPWASNPSRMPFHASRNRPGGAERVRAHDRERLLKLRSYVGRVQSAFPNRARETSMSASDQSAAVIDSIRLALASYVFRVRDEAELQDQVCVVLSSQRIGYRREVRDLGGARFDILCDGGIVLELKLKASAALVERQAQRYAMLAEISAVVVVTTSLRLAAQLMAPGDVGQAPSPTLGGKPFAVIAVRSS